tara:strand:- start:343 stop:597 length:255 start_codon:yes stop_codon:yes gene_type:complete
MDKEDIESLGWDFKEEYVNIDTHIVYEKDNGDLLVFLEKYHHIQILKNPYKNTIPHLGFSGFIKNKNELQTIIKQLEINQPNNQ